MHSVLPSHMVLARCHEHGVGEYYPHWWELDLRELQHHRERRHERGVSLWKKQGGYEQPPIRKTECAQMFRGADVPCIRNNMQVIASRICTCLSASSRGHISVSFGEPDSYQAPFSANKFSCNRLGPSPAKAETVQPASACWSGEDTVYAPAYGKAEPRVFTMAK